MSQATGTADNGLWVGRLSARAIGPLLFALRLWASVCLALYIAFALRLEAPPGPARPPRWSVSRSSGHRCAKARSA